ncbi:MAG: hypothetical protein SFV51_15160 [Bryobacteraceae bacterium]|nr:hypothetical protein [Bryobacteraceae bacterium]
MDKRLQKRHKRQVLRARERVKTSEPDVRTPEQIRAAREASRPAVGHRNDASKSYAGPARGQASATDSRAKVDG